MPPQIVTMIITTDLTESADPDGIADIGLLTHNRWFVGITIYPDSVESAETPVSIIEEIDHSVGVVFMDLTITVGGIETWVLRVKKDRWSELRSFADQVRQSMRG